jgi:hypothetical protein
MPTEKIAMTTVHMQIKNRWSDTVDARCAMLARDAFENARWIAVARSRRDLAAGMPQPLAADTMNYWLDFIIRERRVVQSNADRIIALRTQQAAQSQVSL